MSREDREAARRAREATLPEKRNTSLVPMDCEICECAKFAWNGRSSVLKTDPPSTCRCDHPASRHRFRAEEI